MYTFTCGSCTSTVAFSIWSKNIAAGIHTDLRTLHFVFFITALSKHLEGKGLSPRRSFICSTQFLTYIVKTLVLYQHNRADMGNSKHMCKSRNNLIFVKLTFSLYINPALLFSTTKSPSQRSSRSFTLLTRASSKTYLFFL